MPPKTTSRLAGLRHVGPWAKQNKAWLWLIVPYLFAWIVPVQWSWQIWHVPNHPFSFQPYAPFLALLIAWHERDRAALLRAKLLRKWKAKDWRRKPNYVVLGVGLLFFLFSHIVQVKGFIVLALWLIAVGAVWAVYDAVTVALYWKSFAFALLTVPPPDSVIDNRIHLMQSVTANASALFLQKLHLAGDAYAIGSTLNVKNVSVEINEACSGVNMVLPLLVFLVAYLIYARTPAVRAVLLMVTALIVGLGVNTARVMAVGLLQSANPAQSNDLNTANNYLFIFPILLILAVTDRFLAVRKLKTKKLTAQTQRVAHGAGLAVGVIFRPLDWLTRGGENVWRLFGRSAAGLEKGLARLTPKKKKRRRR